MSTVKLNWSVPDEEWQRFRRYVENKHGKIKGYIGREAERAMREYAESDEYAGVEDLVDRLVRAAGRSAGGQKRENNSVSVGADGEKVRATCRVSKDAKEQFRTHVDQTEMRYGEAFAHACQLRREGGRPERVKDKLERVVDDAEALLKVENDSDDSGSMGKKERQTVQVIRHMRSENLPEGEDFPRVFPKPWVEEAIKEVLCDENSDPYEYYIPEYLEQVKDRLGYVTRPNYPGELIREDELDPTPAYERRELDKLSTDERVEAIRVDLGRRARENGGLRQLDVDRIREELFDSRLRKATVKNYVREAGNYGGYSVKRKHGKLRLKCRLDEIADEELLDYIENGESSSATDDQQTIDEVNDQASVSIDDLDKATPARTDGGGN